LADNPEVGRRFLVYKGRQNTENDGRTVDDVNDRGRRIKVVGIQDTDDERTTDEGQTNRGCEERCVPESSQRVSNGEAIESVGLSIKVLV
jgi:hypothetical protein